MKKVTAEKKREIRWNFTAVLEKLDFADDIALLSFKFNDLREKTRKLTEESARVGLQLNTTKGKTLRTGHAKSEERIVVNGERVEEVEEFARQCKQRRWRQWTLRTGCRRHVVHSRD